MNSHTKIKRVSVIGGGFTGLAAAYELVKRGCEVVLYEKDDDLGGLAGTFEISPGSRVEKFYHHWFTSDLHFFSLFRELGLEDQIKPLPSATGLYYANSQFRLSSPLDLLRFSPLPIADRIRTGYMALRARAIREWEALEELSAEEWIISTAGRKSYELIWKPLLAGKFGEEAANVSAVWFWNKIKLRGSSRNARGAEVLVYYDGGFGAAIDALGKALRERGVEILTGVLVEKICVDQGRVCGLQTTQGERDAETVLATVPLPHFLEMTPDLPVELSERLGKIRFLGNVCLVLRLKQSLSSTYWLNVTDPGFPFVGIIEHTNFDPPEHYGGEHIVYLSKYLQQGDPMYRMTAEELLEFSLPHISRMFPEFSPSWIIGAHLWRAPYSQPVITRRYSTLLPPRRMPIEGLWLATMAQIYPEDRGTNYAINSGRETARIILENDQ